MAFVSIPGLKGKVFVPDKQPRGLKKHPCDDCYTCQMCSGDRCDVCRNRNGGRCQYLAE
jgi:hypothetical protein